VNPSVSRPTAISVRHERAQEDVWVALTRLGTLTSGGSLRGKHTPIELQRKKATRTEPTDQSECGERLPD